MRVLVLDDIRFRHDAFDRIYEGHDVRHAYTYRAFVYLLKGVRWDLVHLDHDLGDFVSDADTYVDGWGKTQEYNGQHAAVRICELPDAELPVRVIIHSVNPDGARAMRQTLERRGVPVTWEPFADFPDADNVGNDIGGELVVPSPAPVQSHT